jgi:hypothetical protein
MDQEWLLVGLNSVNAPIIHPSLRYGCPKASGLAAPHFVRNHLVDIINNTASVIAKGTVRQTYLESKPGSTS